MATCCLQPLLYSENHTDWHIDPIGLSTYQPPLSVPDTASDDRTPNAVRPYTKCHTLVLKMPYGRTAFAIRPPNALFSPEKQCIKKRRDPPSDPAQVYNLLYKRKSYKSQPTAEAPSTAAEEPSSALTRNLALPL